MKRIGIVGSDNSHAIAYSRLINVEKVVGDTASVIGIWGQEAERTQEVATVGQIPRIFDAIPDMIGHVDAVFVVDRHGALHAEHALPFIEAGIPTYVDKPFAIDLDECRRMIAAANRTGTFISTMSSLRITPETVAMVSAASAIGDIRAAQFAGPCDFGSVYGGPFFYATHVVEIAIALLGDGITSLRANRTGQTVVVDATWEGDRQVTMTYLGDAQYHFYVTLFGTDGLISDEIHASDVGYTEIVRKILADMEAQIRPLTDRQLLIPIATVHAIQESLAQEGAPVEIEPFLSTTSI